MSDILRIGLLVSGFFLVVWIACVIDTKRLRRLTTKRQTDSICSFARSLDFRRLDTKVIRAVYDELQHYFDYVSPTFPIRTTDRFDRDLHMDGDDVADIFSTVAKRCGRDLQFTAIWPKERRVETVADMIHNICDLPKRHVVSSAGS